MRDKLNSIGKTGLQFYGKITASISHEIKNVLAIINENAGLLEDLAYMADRGKPIDPERLKLMAAAMHKQVNRADGIIKNMNCFAHSIDESVAEVDLNETIELFIALTDRLAVMQGYKVDLQLPEDPPNLRTAPFLLMNLLWLCLDSCMSAGGSEKRIELVVEETENSVRIRFRCPAGLTEEVLGTFPSEREKNLLTVLSADWTPDPGCEELVLHLSKNIDNIYNR